MQTIPAKSKFFINNGNRFSISTDNQLWLQLWRDQRIDFHQFHVNPLLEKFWSKLDLVHNSRVFVPLCGKSLDMIWLAEQGHEVIGVELSQVAVQDFFRENGLEPIKQKQGEFMLWKSGRISILCGDYFALHKTDLGVFDSVYDRAALTALPEKIRRIYVAQLRLLVPKTVNIFLLTIEDAEENETLAESMGIGEEIRTLYEKFFEIYLTYVDSMFEPDCESLHFSKRTEYKVYRLSRK
ncbi:MAG: thiopurine S-methyltransferase [Methylococcales bacterium]|nr:thiopurine S-methyltransferase [Methylococcales bacterium]